MAGNPEVIPVEGQASVRISAQSGRVHVVAEDRRDVLVERGEASVDPADPNRVQVEGASARVQLRVPTGCDLVVGALSGRVELQGPLGEVSVSAASGRVTVEHAQQIDVRAQSGRVDIGRCEGSCRVNAGSGRAQIGSAGPTTVMVASGAAEIGEVRGPAHLKTTSGRIRVGLAGPYDVEVESVSGRIRIAVPEGVRPEVVLTSGGRTTCEVEVGTDSTIRARSVSGRLEIVRAGSGEPR